VMDQDSVNDEVEHKKSNGEGGGCPDDDDKMNHELDQNGDSEEPEDKAETTQANGDHLDPTDLSLQVVVRNIDKNATSDDLEDFFYDNFENVETIYRETFTSGKGDTKKEMFKGSVILTFKDQASATKFLSKKIKYKTFKLDTILRKDFLQRKKEMNKKREENKERRNNGGNSSDECTVVCTGFHKVASTLQEVVNYMYDNHENIIDVNMEIHRDARSRGFEKWDTETTIVFGDKKAADRFLNLTYVKFKGVYITRISLLDHKVKKINLKRKKVEKKFEDVVLEGASFTLRGFQTDKQPFNYRGARENIKEKLVSSLNVEGDDICYISFRPGDEEAIVRMKSAVGEDLANKWNQNNVKLDDDTITAEVLSGDAEQTYLTKCKEEIIEKEEKKKNWNYGKKLKGSKFYKGSKNWIEDY